MYSCKSADGGVEGGGVFKRTYNESACHHLLVISPGSCFYHAHAWLERVVWVAVPADTTQFNSGRDWPRELPMRRGGSGPARHWEGGSGGAGGVPIEQL